MQIHAARPSARSILTNRPLMTLMFGHFTVDSYVGLFPVFYPLLIERFALNLRTVGLVSLAYSGMASISQPLFGWVADRWGTRFTGLALIWTAVVFATVGFAPSFGVLLALAALAGLGSGAFHPLGALNANAVIDPRQRNTAMSVYVTGGTLGVALGPLIGGILFSVFGLHGTAIMIVPGIGSAIWLLLEMRSFRHVAARRESASTGSDQPVHVLPLLAVIGIMMSRQWTVSSLQAFIPTWYASRGYGASFYGPLATSVVLASAVGAIGCGTLADRWGRRAVMLWSLLLTVPALLLFARFMGPVAFVTGALIGFSAASTGPLMLSMAQQLMAGRAGVASGLVLGLGFVTGAIGVPITGAIADVRGFPVAIESQVIPVLLTVVIALGLPSEAQMEQWSRPPVPPWRSGTEVVETT